MSEAASASETRRIPVWDLPTRVFHWLLVVLAVTSIATVKIGGNAMVYHMWSGYAILALLLFRIVWGFVGGTYARFRSFVRGPAEVLRYAASLLRPEGPRYTGHNPLGGYSVLALLASFGVQAATGLFANDDIATEGPLAVWVSKETSDFLTRIHHWNELVMYALVGIHVAAILFYLVVKRENLVGPMIHGTKEGRPDARSVGGSVIIALAVAAFAGAAVWVLVNSPALR